MAYSRRFLERRCLDEETVIFDKSSVKRYEENVQSRFHPYQARRYQESNNNSWERYSEFPGNSGSVRDPRISPLYDSYIVPGTVGSETTNGKISLSRYQERIRKNYENDLQGYSRNCLVRSESISGIGDSCNISSSDAAQRDFDIHEGRLHDSSRDSVVNHFRNKQYNCNEIQLCRNQEIEKPTLNQGESPSTSGSPNFDVESSDDVSNERTFRYGLIQWTDCKYAKMRINKNCVKRAKGLSKLLNSNKSYILKGCWLKEIVPRNAATQVHVNQENVPKTATTNFRISDQRTSQGQQGATVIHSKFDYVGASESIVTQELQERQTPLNQETENDKSDNTTMFNNQNLNVEEEERPVYHMSVGSLISALRKSANNGNSKESLTKDDKVPNSKETHKNLTNSMICKYGTSSKTGHLNDTNPKVTQKADTNPKATLKNHTSSKESHKDDTSSKGSHIDDSNSKVSHKDGSTSKVTRKDDTSSKGIHRDDTSSKMTRKDDTSSKVTQKVSTSIKVSHKDDNNSKLSYKDDTNSRLSYKDDTSSKGTRRYYTSSKVTHKDDTRSKVTLESRTSSKAAHKNDTISKTHEGSTKLKVTSKDDFSSKVTHNDTDSNISHEDDRSSMVTNKDDTSSKATHKESTSPKYNTGTKVTHESNSSKLNCQDDTRSKETQKDETSTNVIQDDINFNRIQQGKCDTSSKVTHQQDTGFKGTQKEVTHEDGRSNETPKDDRISSLSQRESDISNLKVIHKKNEASSNKETTTKATHQKDNTCPKVAPLQNVDNMYKLKISRPRHVGTPKSKITTEVNSLPNCRTSTERMADGDERNASNYEVDNLDSENIDNIRETIKALVNQKDIANETKRNGTFSKEKLKQKNCSKDNRKIPAGTRREDLVKQTSNKSDFRKTLEDTKKSSENVGKADCSSADARKRKQTESTENLRGKDTELKENEKRKNLQNSPSKEETNRNKKRKSSKDTCILEGNDAERASNRKERVKKNETIEKQHREKDDQSITKTYKEKMSAKEEISVRNKEEKSEKAKKTKEKNCLKNNKEAMKDQRESKKVSGSIQEKVIDKHTDLGKSHKRNTLKPIEKNLEMNILKTVIKHKLLNEKREEKNSGKVNNKSLKDISKKVKTSSHREIRDHETSDEIAQGIHKNSDGKSCESEKSLDMNIQENKRKPEDDHIHESPRAKKNKLDGPISSNEVTVNVSNIAVNQTSSDHSAVVNNNDTSQRKELMLFNEDESINYEAVEIKQECVTALKSEFEENDEPLCEMRIKAEPLWDVHVKSEPIETIEESSGTADYDKKRELEQYLGEWMKIWEVKTNLFDDFYDMLTKLDKPVWRIETHSVLYNIEVNMRRFFLDVYCNQLWDKEAVCKSMQQCPKLSEFFSLFESI